MSGRKTYPREAGDRFAHITTAVTTVVKSTQGVLKRFCINTTVASTVTITDNAATPNTIAVFAASAPVGVYEYNVLCPGGIRVITAGAGDYTVTYE